jgi:His/Glu/Gln/Arg/opine family amino acid ABC transporter permease subunit
VKDESGSGPPLPESGRVSPRWHRVVRAGLKGAWPILVTLAAAVGLFFLLGQALHWYQVPFILQYLASGVGPLKLSLLFTTVSFLIGFLLAIPLGYVRAFPPGGMRAETSPRTSGGLGAVRRALWYPLYGFATGYVAAVRGTPFLVQMFILYYAFIFAYPHLLILGEGPAFWAGLLALTINTTGYQCEALRGGFQSVAHGQVEAARAMGMTRAQVFRRVILPQSLRLITLPLTNEWISNFKTSTILSYITIYELFSWTRSYIAYTLGRPVEAFIMLIIFFVAINVTVSRTVTYLEKRRRIPGLGSLPPDFLGGTRGLPNGRAASTAGDVPQGRPSLLAWVRGSGSRGGLTAVGGPNPSRAGEIDSAGARFAAKARPHAVPEPGRTPS